MSKLEEHDFPLETFIGGYYIPEGICDGLVDYYKDNKIDCTPGSILVNDGRFVDPSIKDSTDLPVNPHESNARISAYLSALGQALFEYQKKYTEPIWETFQKHQKYLPWGGDFPEEATPFFSPAFLWTRPQKTELVETRVFEAFKDYLQAYLIFVKQTEQITNSEKLAEIKEAQLRYLRYRAEKDPARKMLTRFYGHEWTEEYIHGFLFDLERKLALNPA